MDTLQETTEQQRALLLLHAGVPCLDALAARVDRGEVELDRAVTLARTLGVPNKFAKARRRISAVRAERAKRRAAAAPQPSLARRFEEWLNGRYLRAYHACGFRRASSRWVGGEHSVLIHLDPHGACGSETERVWHPNRDWAGINSTHTLSVQAQVLRLPLDRQYGWVGRKRALLLGFDECEARVAMQGRGTGLVMRRVPLAGRRRFVPEAVAAQEASE